MIATRWVSFIMLQRLSVTIIGENIWKMILNFKAFDMLERLDPNPEYWEGKRGACVGVFQMIIAGREDRSDIQNILKFIS